VIPPRRADPLAPAVASSDPEPAPFAGDIDLSVSTGGRIQGNGVGTLQPDGIALSSGRMSAQGPQRIRTREAEVSVGAATVTVTRDSLGTIVEGAPASVRCLGASHARGAATTCLPVSVEGLLARAAALRRRGEAAAERETLDLALEIAERPMLRAEVLYQRATGADVDPGKAIADLEAAHATGASARPDDLERALARLHARQGNCAEALPYLRSLEARGALAEDVVLLTRCSGTP
jgi:hypothetical protein